MTASPTSHTRREERERALGLLYEAEAKGIEPDAVIAELPVAPEPYTSELVVGVGDHRTEIDTVLGAFSRRWPVARMPAMDRTILRTATFELALTGLDLAVVIDEAVELAKSYGGTDDSHRFVNGMLSSVARRVREERPWRPADAVVFDMDGVFRHWTGEASAAFEDENGMPRGAVGEVAFADPVFADAMCGRISAEEWAASIGARLAEEHGADADAAAERWLASSFRLDDEAVALAQDLRRRGVVVALFSNASTRLEEDLAEIGMDGLFDVVINSARIGVTKPDKAAFERGSAMLDVAPERTWFTDDRDENVVGAVEAGWHAVTFDGLARWRRVLGRLGLLPG